MLANVPRLTILCAIFTSSGVSWALSGQVYLSIGHAYLLLRPATLALHPMGFLSFPPVFDSHKSTRDKQDSEQVEGYEVEAQAAASTRSPSKVRAGASWAGPERLRVSRSFLSTQSTTVIFDAILTQKSKPRTPLCAGEPPIKTLIDFRVV